MVGALTSPKKKGLGLLRSGAVNRDRMGFTGLQGLSYSQTIQLICQGDPECSPPSLWFVHASVCLQSGQVIKMRVSKTRPPAWHPAITHLTTIWSLFCVLFFRFFWTKAKLVYKAHRHEGLQCKDRIYEAGEVIAGNPVPLMSCPGDRRMDQNKIWFWQLFNTCCSFTRGLWFT